MYRIHLLANYPSSTGTGPNAVERTVAGYAGEREKTQRDLDIAQGQLSDYEARLGGTFAHAAYLGELTSLRDQLETRLSANEPTPETDALPPVHALVARIKALKAAHTIDATPERSATRRSATAQTPPRHPCHQWERKLTGSSRGKSPLGTRHFLPYTRPMSYML